MINKLMREEEGGVTIFVAFALLALIIAIGCAVDMSRAQTAHSKIQTALDAAGLAAGRSLNTAPVGISQQAWVQQQAQRYFNSNYSAGYLEMSTLTLDPVVITTTGSTTNISLSVKGVQSTSVMGVVGIKQITIGDTSQITTGSEGVELVLAVDNSGSMSQSVDGSGTSKITALKAAANTLVTTIFGTGTVKPTNLFMGIVPFSQAVNVGTSHVNWLSAYPSNFPARAPWYGCVTARPQPYDINDDVPSSSLYGPAGMFQPYLSPNSNALPVTKAEQSNNNVWGSTNPTEKDGSTVGPNYYCPQPVTLLTSDKQTIVNGINSLTAQGDTLLNIGAAWAQRMLSPKWIGTWGGTMNDTGSTLYPTLPLQYNTPGMQKVLILMTDGWNHVSETNYNAYGWLDSGAIGGAKTEAPAETNLVNYTKQVCDSMKSNGIIIYTIGFGKSDTGGSSSSTSSVDGDLLKYCATDSTHYFLAPTNAALTQAFETIGTSISSLRVSK